MSVDANPPDGQQPLDKAGLVKRIIKQIKMSHAMGMTSTLISPEAEPLWLEILMQAPEAMLLKGETYTSEIEAYVSKKLAKRTK